MDFPVRLERTEAEGVVNTALENGVNLFDTADAYGTQRGEGEEILGELIKGKRDRILLATKFWVKMEDWPNRGDCSRYHIIRAVEESLRRLQTDHIDLYQLHQPSKLTPVEEILSALDSLEKQGKVRYVGVCNHYAWQMAHMLGVSALGADFLDPVPLQHAGPADRERDRSFRGTVQSGHDGLRSPRRRDPHGQVSSR